MNINVVDAWNSETKIVGSYSRTFEVLENQSFTWIYTQDPGDSF